MVYRHKLCIKDLSLHCKARHVLCSCKLELIQARASLPGLCSHGQEGHSTEDPLSRLTGLSCDLMDILKALREAGSALLPGQRGHGRAGHIAGRP